MGEHGKLIKMSTSCRRFSEGSLLVNIDRSTDRSIRFAFCSPLHHCPFTGQQQEQEQALCIVICYRSDQVSRDTEHYSHKGLMIDKRRSSYSSSPIVVGTELRGMGTLLSWAKSRMTLHPMAWHRAKWRGGFLFLPRATQYNSQWTAKLKGALQFIASDMDQRYLM